MMRVTRIAFALTAVLSSAPCRAQSTSSDTTSSDTTSSDTTSGDMTPSPPEPEHAEERSLQARALFQQGRDAMQEGRADEACARFRESLGLSRSIGALLNLGLCHRAAGRLATALGYFREAEQLSKQQGDTERGAKAAADALQLEDLVGRLTVNVLLTSDSELRITVDGAELPRAQWGTAIPEDAGWHRVVATSRDERHFDAAVQDGASSIVTISPVPSAPATALRRPVAYVAAPKPAPAAPAPSTVNIGTYVLGGLGFVSVGVGLGFGVAAWKTYSAAEAACPRHVNCVPGVSGQYSDAVTDATVANVTVALGLTAVAAGAILYVFQSKPHRDSTARAPLSVSPTLSGIEGRF
jgi:hypothetical protein